MSAVLKPDTSPPRAWALEVTEGEYRNDPSLTPSLNQSVAKEIVNESPLHGWTVHPRLGGQKWDSTAAQNEGTVLHKLVLGVGAQVEVVNFADFRTKAAQTERDAAIAAGCLPMIAHKYEAIVDAAIRIRERIAALGFDLDSGHAEAPFGWTEEGARGPIFCRGLLDHVDRDRGVILDVKKVASANPKHFSRSIIEYGYDIQRASYTHMLELLEPQHAGCVQFYFLLCEIEPPYCVVPVELDGQACEVGDRRWRQALDTWEECLHTGCWPGYANGGVARVSLPGYHLTDYLGAY